MKGGVVMKIEVGGGGSREAERGELVKRKRGDKDRKKEKRDGRGFGLRNTISGMRE